MSKEIDDIAAIIDRVKERVWQDGYYLDYNRHRKSIAQAIHEGGYRRKTDVVKEIIDEIEDYIINECFVTDKSVAQIYGKILAIKKRHTMGLGYQERVCTGRELKELYKRVKNNPSIQQYRGYTESKSYGYDEETQKIIVKEGEFWFNNPSFRGG